MNVVETCVTTQDPLSTNTITVLTTNPVAPSIEIETSSSSVCSSDKVTFTSKNEQNGGTLPSYQWLKNGIPIASETGKTLLIDATELANNEKISLQMTSDIGCLIPDSNPATSDEISITVGTSVPPTVDIQAVGTTEICANSKATFKAIAGAGNGASAVYEWFVDDISTTKETSSEEEIELNFGTNPSYQVHVLAKNLSSCANAPTVKSDKIAVTVIAPITPEITISAVTNNGCPNDKIEFKVDKIVKDKLGDFEWFVNGIATGVKGKMNVSSTDYPALLTAKNLDITAKVVLGTTCNTAPEKLSNSIKIQIKDEVVPSVAIDLMPPTPYCQGEDVSLKATPTNGGTNPTFTWKNNGSAISGQINVGNELNINNLPIGANQLTVEMTPSADAGCLTKLFVPSGVQPITILKSENLTVLIEGNTGQICENDLLNLTAKVSPQNVVFASNLTYEWTIGGSVVGGNAGTFAKNYTTTETVNLKVSSDFKCLLNPTKDDITSQTIDVLIPTIPTLSVDEKRPCEGTKIVFTPTTKGSVIWYKDNAPITFSGTISSIKLEDKGTYKIGTKEGVCTEKFSTPTEITVLKKPIVDIILPDYYVILEGEEADLTAQVSDFTNFNWSNSTNQNLVADKFTYKGFPSAETVVTLKAWNEKETCFAEDMATIHVIQKVKTPNVFTPNGDGIHDTWEIEAIKDYPKARVQIYTRWGQKIFESFENYHENPWDGTYNGKASTMGVYYYVIELNSEITKLNIPLKGEVHIIK